MNAAESKNFKNNIWRQARLCQQHIRSLFQHLSWPLVAHHCNTNSCKLTTMQWLWCSSTLHKSSSILFYSSWSVIFDVNLFLKVNASWVIFFFFYAYSRNVLTWVKFALLPVSYFSWHIPCFPFLQFYTSDRRLSSATKGLHLIKTHVYIAFLCECEEVNLNNDLYHRLEQWDQRDVCFYCHKLINCKTSGWK